MDHFNSVMDLSPEESKALSEIIRDYINKKRIVEDREAREEEEKARDEFMEEKK